MGFRFRRSFRIAPGLRINTSLRGASLSIGGRGVGTTFGRRGMTSRVGIPGTGISFVGTSGTGGRRRSSRSSGGSGPSSLNVRIAVQDDGTVTFKDDAGTPLPPALVKKARQQFGDQLAELLRSSCERFNSDLAALSTIHVASPHPSAPHPFEEDAFAETPPVPPGPPKLGFLERLFRGRRERKLAAHAQALREFDASRAEWEGRRAVHDAGEARRRWLYDHGRMESLDGIVEYVESVFSSIAWPRETMIEVGATGPADAACVWLNVDLPEIEQMPLETASVPARALKLTIKPRAESHRRRDYALHVHGVLFRLIAETFAAIPTAGQVVASGYTQRPDRATGVVGNMYVLSVSVGREEWEEIDFANLATVDPGEALARFDLRRKLVRGDFSEIEPFSPEPE